jgi:hypothetical protein
MPRLPDVEDLGARPVPQSRRGIASNSRAGAVGDAIEGVGRQITGVGQQMLEKQDRFAIAAAKSAVQQADIAVRQELEADPTNYETWESRYAEKMKTARAQASKLIRSGSDRALFDRDIEVDIARGNSQVQTAVLGKRRAAGRALLYERLAVQSDVGQDALDDATRESAINTANELIAGAEASGFIDVTEATKLRRGWPQEYIAQQIETRRMRGDLDGAMALYEANRTRLDADLEVRLGHLLTDAMNHRKALTVADEIVSGTTTALAPSSSSGSAPADMSKMVSITAYSESRNRDFANGRPVTSSAGAMFAMQVMPATARDPGHGIRPAGSQTPEEYNRVGRELLAALLKKYGGDAAKAWAAYNWGEGRVDRAVKKHGANWLSAAPSATRNYVRQNLNALGGGSVAASGGSERPDLGSALDQVDARALKEGWTPEMRASVRSEVTRRVSQQNAIINQREDQAYEQALAKAEALGSGFTNVSQLGDAYYRASVTQRATLRGIAEANSRPEPTPANGDVILALHNMEMDAPAEFANLDLRPYRAHMTPAEFDDLVKSQGRAREGLRGWSPREGIVRAIQWGKNFGGVKIGSDPDRYRVYRYIEARAREFRAETKGKAPAEGDYQRWFREATAKVDVSTSFLGIDILRPDKVKRSYDILSPNYRALIRRQFRALFGRDPNENEMQEWFDRMGGALQ